MNPDDVQVNGAPSELGGGSSPAQAPIHPPPSAAGSPGISHRRLIGVDALIGVTTVLLIVGMFAVWANRLLFSPDNWSNASTQLLTNPDVRSGTAGYVVDQVYANVNVAAYLKSALPPQLQPLAAPAAGALRNVAVQGTELALTRPRVQSLWAQANRAADRTFVAIVKGGKGPVAVNQGAVTLNLSSLVDTVAARLGLPSNLGAKLPASVANLTVFKANQLKYLQNGGNAIQGLALWLTILVPVLYVVALLLAGGHRRRTLMTIGFAGVFAGVVVLFGRSVLETQITNSLTHDDALRPAIRATIGIGTELLSQVAGACILIAVAVIVAAWFAGPARLARAGRWAMTPFLREHAGGSFATTLGILVLLFIVDPIPATGKPAGMAVFTVLALVATEALRRQAVGEFPHARPGDATRALRARMQRFRGRDQKRAPAFAAPTTADQLRQLADLRADGAISPAEYDAAKSQLLSV